MGAEWLIFAPQRFGERRDEAASGKGWPKDGKEEKKMGEGFFLIRGLGGERDDRFLHRRLESRRDEGASGKGWPKEEKEEQKMGEGFLSHSELWMGAR